MILAIPRRNSGISSIWKNEPDRNIIGNWIMLVMPQGRSTSPFRVGFRRLRELV